MNKMTEFERAKAADHKMRRTLQVLEKASVTAEKHQLDTYKELNRYMIIGAAAGLALVMARFNDGNPSGLTEVGYALALIGFGLSLFCAMYTFNMHANTLNEYRAGIKSIADDMHAGKYPISEEEMLSSRTLPAVVEAWTAVFKKVEAGYRHASLFHSAAFWMLIGSGVVATVSFFFELGGWQLPSIAAAGSSVGFAI